MKRGLAAVDGHQRLRARVGQRPQQHGVDDAEDGAVGADAERQRQHRRQRVTLVRAQRAQGEADVLRDVVHDVGAMAILDQSLARLTQLGLDGAPVPERVLGRAPRVGGCHPLVDVLVRAHLDVERQLAIDIAAGAARAEAQAKDSLDGSSAQDSPIRQAMFAARQRCE